MFTYSNDYWEVYIRFQGDFLGLGGVEGKGVWEDLSLEVYFTVEEKFNEGGAGFSSITIKKKQ